MATYEKIASSTVTAATSSSVVFSNIPQTYQEIKLVGSVRSNVVNQGDFIYFYIGNAGTGSYDQVLLRADGTGMYSSTSSVSYYPLQNINGGGTTSNVFGNFEVTLPNYTDTSYKQTFLVDIVSEGAASGNTTYIDIQGGMWSVATSVVSLTMNSGSGHFVQYSSFDLYGLKKS